MSLFRVNLDGDAKSTHYTREPTITDDGHLKYVDMDGRLRMVSRASEWTVTEVTEDMIRASPRLQELLDGQESGYEVWSA